MQSVKLKCNRGVFKEQIAFFIKKKHNGAIFTKTGFKKIISLTVMASKIIKARKNIHVKSCRMSFFKVNSMKTDVLRSNVCLSSTGCDLIMSKK